MADIILIQPEIGEMDFLRTQPFLPLNLLHAATLVADSYNVKVIDQRLDRNWQKTLSEALAGPVICIGITAYTGKMIKGALDASRFVKERSDAPVVWGGIHASLLPEQTLQSEYIDIVIQGEGEVTFFELAEALRKKGSLSGIKGLWFKEGGEIRRNPPRPPSQLDDLPDVPYHLVDVKQYMPMYRKRPSIALQTSRGCIYHCSYCYNTAYNASTWRYLSAENTVERIKYVVNKFKAGNIYIIDDNFFIDLERARRIAEGIIREKLDIEWQVQGVGFDEVEKMDDAYLKLLEDSGCVRFTCGLESGSTAIRKKLNKGSTIERIIQINRRLSKYRILVFYSFITGLPGETVDDLRKTIDIIFQVIKENNMARNSPIYTFVPYPQTPLIKMLEKEGYIFPDRLVGWENYDFGNLGREGIPYVSERLKKIIKLNFLYYLSFFLDKKLLEYETSNIIKILALIYRPIARFRVRHLFFGLALDKKILDLGLRLVLRRRK